jgi:hypothetical protein
MRLHLQRLIEGGDLGDGTTLGTSSDTASPADRAEQAHELALSKTFTAPRDPAARTGRPSARSLSTFGQHIFDQMESQHAC